MAPSLENKTVTVPEGTSHHGDSSLPSIMERGTFVLRRKLCGARTYRQNVSWRTVS